MEFTHPSGDAQEVWQDGERTVVEAGGRIEATGDQAKQLEAQGWVRADKPKRKPAAQAPVTPPVVESAPSTGTTDTTKDGEQPCP